MDRVLRVADPFGVLFILNLPTRTTLECRGLLERHPACTLLLRLGFLEFNALLQGAAFVVTDGGSNPEECF